MNIMKTLSLLLIVGGLMTGVAACGGPGNDRRDKDATDSLYIDSVANDSATWGDTTRTPDSLASPSFP